MNDSADARHLALLGIILQSLHVLFGITAIMGVLIAHVRLASVQDAIYYSQIRWQIVTFWTAFAAYLFAFWLWVHHEQFWPMALAVIFVIYRLAISIAYWCSKREILRWF